MFINPTETSSHSLTIKPLEKQQFEHFVISTHLSFLNEQLTKLSTLNNEG
jgi:hypothetical protein